jgi:hypothetical protein
MRSRLTKVGVTLAALGALAAGGSALATAGHKASPAKPAVVLHQSSQPAQDNPGEAPESSAEPQSGADTDNVQQGDQTGTDPAGAAADSQSELAGSESGASDGPGGYADANPNADTQQQGEN